MKDHTAPDHGNGPQIAWLLRAAADGELSPEQRARLDAHLREHPEDAARVEFELRLREACARAGDDGPAAPSELRRRVESMLAAARTRAAEPAPPAPIPIRRWRAAQMLAAAAVVLLTVTVAFLAGRHSAPLSHQAGSVHEVVRFAQSEHDRCAHNPDARAKFTVHDTDALAAEWRAMTGAPLPECIVTWCDRLRFVEGGACRLPGGSSMHLRFTFDGGIGQQHPVSLWVQTDSGLLPLSSGTTFTVAPVDASGPPGAWLWRNNGVIFLLIATNREAAESARSLFGAPEHSGTL